MVLPQYAPAVTHVLSVTSSPADVLSDVCAVLSDLLAKSARILAMCFGALTFSCFTFHQARAQDKVIASLTWLDDVISSGELFPPTSLVHRVVPKHPVPGAEKLVWLLGVDI